MKRMIFLLVLSLFLTAACPVFAEISVPADAVMVSETDMDDVRITVYDVPGTGEQLTLTSDIATGMMRSLKGQSSLISADAPMDADAAKALLLETCPDALVVSASESNIDTAAVLKLVVVAPDFCGYILFDVDSICGRDLSFDECIIDGMLTAKTASSIMQLLRPEAKITEIELDHDDGLLLYEGEAYVNGVEYEFELDAYSGKLLQWDRD